MPMTTLALRPRAVDRGVGYIEAHLCEPLQLDSIAAAACMSRFHFARVFRAHVGLSPMEYQRQRRIERAQELLGEGGQRICEIASALGFYDQSHFVRAFRRAAGCTPSDYALRASARRPGTQRGAAQARNTADNARC